MVYKSDIKLNEIVFRIFEQEFRLFSLNFGVVNVIPWMSFCYNFGVQDVMGLLKERELFPDPHCRANEGTTHLHTPAQKGRFVRICIRRDLETTLFFAKKPGISAQFVVKLAR